MDAVRILSQAVESARRGALDEAETLCRSVLSNFPGHFRALVALGDILTLEKRPGEALAAYETAGKAVPGHSVPFDPLPSISLPRIDEAEFGLGSSQVLSDRDVSGYFCGGKAEWKSRADEFRALFTPGRKIRPLLDRAQGALDTAGKTIIAIHLRRADPVIEHDQITEAQRTILESQFRPDDVVVHVGQHCSPWTNLARSLRPAMRIHELGEGQSVDEFRRQQGGGPVKHLVAENFTSLARTLAGASASLSRAGVQMVHFRIPPEGDVPALPDELKRGGYRLFVSLNGSLKPADADVPLAPGCYVAVQERAVTSLALSGRAAP